MTFVDLTRAQIDEARRLATRWGIPTEIVIGYLFSERGLPSSVEVVEDWANRHPPERYVRAYPRGPWRRVVGAPDGAT